MKLARAVHEIQGRYKEALANYRQGQMLFHQIHDRDGEADAMSVVPSVPSPSLSP